MSHIFDVGLKRLMHSEDEELSDMFPGSKDHFSHKPELYSDENSSHSYEILPLSIAKVPLRVQQKRFSRKSDQWQAR